MEYNKNIQVYEVNESFFSPLAENPNTSIASSTGDIVVVIDDDVYIKNWQNFNLIKEPYSKANYHANFVKMNSGEGRLFKKIA